MNKRYKMVKFFERRKVTRRLKSLLRQLKTDTLDITERDLLIKEIQQARADLNYITHYPVGEKYLALYPTTSTSDKSLRRRAILYQRILVKIKKGNLEDAIISGIDPDSLGVLPSLETGLLPQGGDVNLDDIVKQEEDMERNETEEEDTEQDGKDETEKQELIEHDKEFRDNLSEEEDIGVKNSKIRNSKSITTTPVLSEQRTKKKKHKLKRDEEIRSLELSSKCLEPTMDDDEFTSLFLKKRRQKVTAACDEEGEHNESSLTKKIKNDPFFL